MFRFSRQLMNSEPSLEDTEGGGSVIEQVIRKQEKGVNYQEPQGVMIEIFRWQGCWIKLVVRKLSRPVESAQ